MTVVMVEPLPGPDLGKSAPAGGDSSEGCEAAVAAMDAADPELDPVWGLLLGAGEPEGRATVARVASQNALEAASTGVVLTAPVLDQAEPAPPAARRGPISCVGKAEAPPDHFPPPADVGSLTDVCRGVEAPPPAARRRPISNVVDKAEVLPDHFPLPADVGSLAAVRRDVEGCDAFVLDGVLTAEECTSLVEQAEGLWSFWDDSECPRVSFRNAHTVEVTHQELADRIWHRIEQLVTPSLFFSEEDERFEVDIDGSWQPYAMNPKLLLSRYLDGGHFSPHTDGTTVVDFNRRTFYSCVLFLNASPWGGHTRIYDDAQLRRELVQDDEGRLTGDPELILDAVPPVPGRMVVFYHRLMHEGVPAKEKYIVRTDVLYRRVPERCTAPEDTEAFEMYQEAQLLAERGECKAAAELFRRAFKRSPALRQVYRS